MIYIVDTNHGAEIYFDDDRDEVQKLLTGKRKIYMCTTREEANRILAELDETQERRKKHGKRHLSKKEKASYQRTENDKVIIQQERQRRESIRNAWKNARNGARMSNI